MSQNVHFVWFSTKQKKLKTEKEKESFLPMPGFELTNIKHPPQLFFPLHFQPPYLLLHAAFLVKLMNLIKFN